MQRPEYRAGRYERAVKIYTVCDESRFLIVRNVPALGCIDELIKLFGLYGDIEEFRLLDEEECEPFTDVYWIKYTKYSNSRFAKRKLDNYKFLGNLLEVSYGPNYESLTDTKNKLEERRRTVLNRIRANEGSRVRPPQVERTILHLEDPLLGHSVGAQQYPPFPLECLPSNSGGKSAEVAGDLQVAHPGPMAVMEDHASSKHFPSASMNATVQLVRERLSSISDINALHPGVGQEFPEEKMKGLVGREVKGKRPILEDTLPVASQKRQDTRRRI